MQRPLDLAAPEFEEAGEFRKGRGMVDLLPDEGLQHARMVGQVIEDLGGGEPPVGDADEAFEAVQHATRSFFSVPAVPADDFLRLCNAKLAMSFRMACNTIV